MDSIKIFDYSKKQHRVASINNMPKHDTFILKTFVVFLLIIAWLCAGSFKTNATDLYIPEGYKIKKHVPLDLNLQNEMPRVIGIENEQSATEVPFWASGGELGVVERIYNMEASGYTKECGYPWDDGYTSTGAEAKTGRTVAVDPEIIPLGSKLTIEGFDGVFIAEDVGAAIKDYKIDVYFGEGEEARRKALNFGRREVRVRVIEN